MEDNRLLPNNDAISAKAAQHGAVTVDFYNTTIFTDLVAALAPLLK